MAVESATFISGLDATKPLVTDPKSEGDDHLRLLKSTIKATFPNVTGAVTPTHTELNYVDGVTSAIQTQLDTLTTDKAPKASPTFTGTVTLPSTTSVGTVSSTEIGYLDGVTSSIQTQLDAKADVTGETYTGAHNFTGATVTVATQASTDNTTKPASTAMVQAAILASSGITASLPAQSGNAGKYLKTDGTTASWQESAALAPSPFAVTYDEYITLSSTTVAPTPTYLNIDAGREIIISRTGDAFVYDKTTDTIGSVVAYRTSGNYNVAALLIGTDKVLVASCATSSTAMQLVVLSLTGTSISVGTAATVTLAGNYTGAIRMLAVGSTYVTSYYRATNIGGMFGATVSGTTVSTGSEVTIAGAVTGGVQMIGIDSAKFLATTVVSPTFTAVPVSVSGTTLTLGTSATTTASATTTGDLMALASGRFIQAYLNTTCFAALISVSGTTATISTAQVSTISSVTSMKTVVVGSAALIAAMPTSNIGFNVITDSSGTASAGTELTVDTTSSANSVHTMSNQMFGLGNSQNFLKVTVNGANPLLTPLAEPVSPKLSGGLTTSSTTRVITKANGSAVLIAGWNDAVSIRYDGTTVTAVSPYSYGDIASSPRQVPGTDAYWGVPITAYGGKFRFTRGSLA